MAAHHHVLVLLCEGEGGRGGEEGERRGRERGRERCLCCDVYVHGLFSTCLNQIHYSKEVIQP